MQKDKILKLFTFKIVSKYLLKSKIDKENFPVYFLSFEFEKNYFFNTDLYPFPYCTHLLTLERVAEEMSVCLIICS